LPFLRIKKGISEGGFNTYDEVKNYSWIVERARNFTALVIRGQIVFKGGN
jgi:hypothetical protein